MKRLRLFSLLLVLSFLIALLSGCGASSGSTANGSADQAVAGEAEMAVAEDAGAGDYGFATEESQSDADAVTRPSDAKLIYTGNLTLECTDLNTAMTGLEDLVIAHGGYMERQEVYHQTNWQTADYTVRVPSEQYEAFLNSVTEWEGCKVTYQSTSVDDVGEIYADIENRLETLQIKLDRLQCLLAQAESMEDIITIESAISEVEYEIEDLSGQKNHYDSLIDYSTVYISLQQVNTFSEGVNPTLGERLSRGFTKGLGDFAQGCANLLVWVVSNLIGVVIFLAVVAAVVLVLVRRRRRKKGRELPSVSVEVQPGQDNK